MVVSNHRTGGVNCTGILTAIQKSISSLTFGKTLLVIAHRLSTIANADNIVVVKDGQIIAQGKQEELLQTCPLYISMWQAHITTRDVA